MQLQSTNKINLHNYVIEIKYFRNSLPLISTYNNANDQLVTHRDPFMGFSNNLPEKPLKKVEAGRNKLQQIVSTFNKVCTQDELIDRLIDLLKWEER